MTTFLRRNRPLLVTLLIVALVLLWMVNRYPARVSASILLSGLTLGALYFLVASGLSLIFGLMDVLNFAHGVIFMIGAYFGFTAYANPRLILNTVPFMLAILGAVLIGRWAGGYLPQRLGRRDGSSGRCSSGCSWRQRSSSSWAPGLRAGGTGCRNRYCIGRRGIHRGRAGGSGRVHPEGCAPGRCRPPAGPGLEPDGYGGDTPAHGLARRGAGCGPDRGRVRRDPPPHAGRGIPLADVVQHPLRPGAARRPLGRGGLGALIETSVIRPLYSRPIYQVLLTLGLSFVGTELVKGVWGTAGFYMDIPALFAGRGEGCPSPSLWSWFSDHCQSIDVLGRPFPSYRLFIIALGVVMFVAIALLLKKTRLGIIIRAGVQDSEMVQALGINVRRVFTLVFAIGCALAALGGVAAAPFLGVNLGLGSELLLQPFIAVVIGGMGNFVGSAVGALLVGMARAFGDQLVLSGIQLPWMDDVLRMSPAIARASTVLIMALVLLLRPAGLFGKKE
jgi:branched-subunit amino acid ABC-type transport system permease component